MNLFKLKEFNENRIIYLYQPEGRGEWGEVLYSFVDGAAIINKRAEENSSIHDNMALIKIKKQVESKNLPLEFTQAWY